MFISWSCINYSNTTKNNILFIVDEQYVIFGCIWLINTLSCQPDETFHTTKSWSVTYNVFQMNVVCPLIVCLQAGISGLETRDCHPGTDLRLMSLAFLHWVRITFHPWPFISDIAIFVLKRDVKLQLTNLTHVLEQGVSCPLRSALTAASVCV